MANEILLESGTNEVEFLEFYLDGLSYAINVAKIAQITPLIQDHLTLIPDNPPSVLGTLLWQKKTIPLIDLHMQLNKKKIGEACERPIVLVTEFNNVINGFLTEGVNRIHRISWEDISPLSSYLGNYSDLVTGSIHIEDREIMLVDFEYIIAELFPDTKMGYRKEDAQTQAPARQRENMHIIFAEDSHFIRTTILDLLKNAGYTHVDAFENGEDALNHIRQLITESKKAGSDIKKRCSLIISDIEMPKMDGLTLCRLAKEQLGPNNIPVIIFSSLINDQMVQKCKEVNADDYTTKPQINELLSKMDRHLHIA